MSTAAVKIARSEWNAATRAWSRDDCSDVVKLMKAGERMLFAAIDLICALEDAAEAAQPNTMEGER